MKKYLLLSLLLLNVGCAALTNNNKPDIKDGRALANASVNGVVEYRSRYTYGNVAMMLLFPIGTVIGIVGDSYDSSHNYKYVVIDKEKYPLWKEQWLKNEEKRKADFFNN